MLKVMKEKSNSNCLLYLCICLNKTNYLNNNNIVPSILLTHNMHNN